MSLAIAICGLPISTTHFVLVLFRMRNYWFSRKRDIFNKHIGSISLKVHLMNTLKWFFHFFPECFNLKKFKVVRVWFLCMSVVGTPLLKYKWGLHFLVSAISVFTKNKPMFALPDKVTNLDCTTTHWVELVNEYSSSCHHLHLIIYL